MKLLKKKRLWLLTLFPLSMVILELAKKNVFFAEEVMAQRGYKVISVAAAAVTGWLPFSLAEFTVVLCPFLLLFFLVRFVVHMVKRKEERFFRGILAIVNVACVAAVIFFVYVIGCGVNYHRTTVADHCEITVRESSKEELFALCVELAEQASTLREGLVGYEDENGVLRLPVSDRALGKLTKEAYEALAKELPVLSGFYPAPKGICFSEAFSAMEITGIFTCWTMEANVNVAIPDYSIASTMAHELGHLHGFMREEEANFLAYLACMASDSELLNYSGTMMALIHSGNALNAQDSALYTELWAYYHEGMVRDLMDNRAYWDRYRDTVISETADKVNDTYLKVNEQEDGVKSYGRVVDLLLANYRKEHGLK